MSDAFDINSADVKIRVTGLRKLVKDLERAGVDAQDIKDVMGDAGDIVVRKAVSLAPSRTGALAANIRASRAKTKVVLKVGAARVPYARFVYFGRSNPEKGGLYQKGNPFIYNALVATRTQVFNRIELGVSEILKKHDLV